MGERRVIGAKPVSTSVETGRGRVLLFCSPDVLATIGRPGLLEDRVGTDAIVREEPRRSDVLLQDLVAADARATIDIPPFLSDGVTTSAGDPDVRVVVLSLEPEVLGPPPWRHTGSGWLIQPGRDYAQDWPQDVVDWLHDGFEPLPDLDPSESLENLAQIAEILSADGRSVVVYNLSTYDPSDQTHRYTDVADTYEVRAHRAVAALERMAGDRGVALVDVDGAVAEVGAIGNVPAPGRLDAAAVEFVTEEAVLAIDQAGALEGTLQAPVMKLRVPPFDRRTTDGAIAKWHFRSGDEISNGDVMFEVRFDREVHRFDMAENQASAESSRRVSRPKRARSLQALDISVVAGGDAILQEILLPEGTPVSVGSVAAIVTTAPTDHVSIDDATGDFRVGARVAGS